MPLPDNLERLKHIPIDTLGLSDSTCALLKWFNFTSILDCIEYFYEVAHYTSQRISDPWPRYYLLLFDEVKPALITAGYWDLVLDAEMWRALDAYKWHILHLKDEGRIVRWQGRDQNLYDIPFEQLSLFDAPDEVRQGFDSVGACIDGFLDLLRRHPKCWLELRTYQASERPANKPLDFDAYTLRVVQPRLVELGYWRFVEDYIDDFIEESRFQGYWEDHGEWDT